MWIFHEDILAKIFSGLVGPGHITGIANHILWKDSRLIVIRNHCYYRYIQKHYIYQILYIYHRIVHLLWACCVFSLPPSHWCNLPYSNRYWVLHQANKGMFRSSTFHEWPPRMIWTYCIGNGWTQHMLPQLTLKIWKVSPMANCPQVTKHGNGEFPQRGFSHLVI